VTSKLETFATSPEKDILSAGLTGVAFGVQTLAKNKGGIIQGAPF